MVQRGDRFRFCPHREREQLSTQDVIVTRVIDIERFYCVIKDQDSVETEILCQCHEVPGYGLLEPLADDSSKQHDQITLEEWRLKARSPLWPRGG